MTDYIRLPEREYIAGTSTFSRQSRQCTSDSSQIRSDWMSKRDTNGVDRAAPFSCKHHYLPSSGATLLPALGRPGTMDFVPCLSVQARTYV